MSIYKRGKTYWIQFTNPNGERIQRSAGTQDKQQAQELHDRLKAESWRVKELGAKPRYTWQQAVVRYISESENQRSLKTTKEVLRYLHVHLDDKNLDEINRSTVDYIKQHKKSTGVTIGTVNRTLTVLRAILNAAKSWEWIDTVPTVQLFKVDSTRVRWITPEEAKRLLEELPEHLQALMQFSVATGLRASNVTGLQWSQVDMVRRCAWIHSEQAKAKKAIAVPLNDDAMAVLRSREKMRADIGIHITHIFTYRGNPIKQAGSKAWRKALKRAGIEDFRYHDLRHTWASYHRMNGTPIDIIKDLGGWASFEMVFRYAHLSSDHLQEYAKNSGSVTNLLHSEKSNVVKTA